MTTTKNTAPNCWYCEQVDGHTTPATTTRNWPGGPVHLCTIHADTHDRAAGRAPADPFEGLSGADSDLEGVHLPHPEPDHETEMRPTISVEVMDVTTPLGGEREEWIIRGRNATRPHHDPEDVDEREAEWEDYGRDEPTDASDWR